MIDPPRPAGTTAAAGCGFTAPASLYWQLQWDDTNTFYSGTYYNLRNNPGWSAMSGNYGSWWGTNYHVGLCYTNYANQYYANDWPAQHWANAYAAFSGYVEWAGWGTDGFATLGRYVVVRSGSYRNVTAHLVAIRAGVTWGTWLDAYWDVIGWAGDTGGPWDPHLHARVSWGESLTGNGQPYGGQAVAPDSYRCFDCTDYDVDATGAGGYYTQFWHGRWMRY
jgi:murein DD-endopeptidase MepM/ murein hydrolase activator NlpD